jgi:hypothetical protein
MHSVTTKMSILVLCALRHFQIILTNLVPIEPNRIVHHWKDLDECMLMLIHVEFVQIKLEDVEKAVDHICTSSFSNMPRLYFFCDF